MTTHIPGLEPLVVLTLGDLTSNPRSSYQILLSTHSLGLVCLTPSSSAYNTCIFLKIGGCDLLNTVISIFKFICGNSEIWIADLPTRDPDIQPGLSYSNSACQEICLWNLTSWWVSRGLGGCPRLVFFILGSFSATSIALHPGAASTQSLTSSGRVMKQGNKTFNWRGLMPHTLDNNNCFYQGPK